MIKERSTRRTQAISNTALHCVQYKQFLIFPVYLASDTFITPLSLISTVHSKDLLVTITLSIERDLVVVVVLILVWIVGWLQYIEQAQHNQSTVLAKGKDLK